MLLRRDGRGQWTQVRVGRQPIQTPTTPAVNSTTLASREAIHHHADE